VFWMVEQISLAYIHLLLKILLLPGESSENAILYSLFSQARVIKQMTGVVDSHTLLCCKFAMLYF